MLSLPSNWHHVHLSQTDSSMRQIGQAEYASSPAEFTLITTDFQEAGRGQRGTHWEADAGQNLLFSFSFHPKFLPAHKQFYLSEALALAVREMLANYVANVCVKWPNDVYYRDYKLCGMLLEHDLQGSHIATTRTGVGININQTAFKGDAPNPLSLKQITGRTYPLPTLLQQTLQAFERRYRLLEQGAEAELHEEYMRHLYRATGFHPFSDAQGTFRAEIVRIAPTGQLTLRKTNGTEKEYAFKEVSFK